MLAAGRVGLGVALEDDIAPAQRGPARRRPHGHWPVPRREQNVQQIPRAGAGQQPRDQDGMARAVRHDRVCRAELAPKRLRTADGPAPTVSVPATPFWSQGPRNPGAHCAP